MKQQLSVSQKESENVHSPVFFQMTVDNLGTDSLYLNIM